MGKLLTVKDVCALSGVSRGTVIAWIRSDRLPAFKLGGGRLWRVREIDLKHFIEGKASKRSKRQRRAGALHQI